MQKDKTADVSELTVKANEQKEKSTALDKEADDVLQERDDILYSIGMNSHFDQLIALRQPRPSVSPSI